MAANLTLAAQESAALSPPFGVDTVWPRSRDAYLAHKAHWLRNHLGHFIAIRGDAFGTPQVWLMDAINEGLRIFSDGKYCIVRIGDDEQIDDLPLADE